MTKLFKKAIKSKDPLILEKALKGCDPLDYGDEHLNDAVKTGHTDLVLVWLNFFGPRDYNFVSYLAAKNGHLQCLKLLMNADINPTEGLSAHVEGASRFNQLECLKYLLSVCDHNSLKSSGALAKSVKAGHRECFDVLLPLSDPKLNQSLALVMACEYYQEEMFEILYPLSNPQEALKVLQQKHGEHALECLSLQQRIISEKEQQTLTRITKNKGSAKSVKKI